jgi:ECF transporter S component (folate family)
VKLYKTPFSAGYWHDAVSDAKKVRTLVMSALMIAACVALGRIPSIRVTTGVSIGWGFLARATCAMIGGPINALVFGLAEDTISYLLNPSGPYFPGYALTTMLGTMVYALFLYRTKVTIWRIFLAKLCNNVINVFLGSLWSTILYSKGYFYYVGTRVVTNGIMLPIQTVMLTVLFAALIPSLIHLDLMPSGSNGLKPRRKKKT